MEQNECLRRAEDAIGRAGFGAPEQTAQSRYGVTAEYTAAVRCVANHGIAFFIVSGPSRAQADAMAGSLLMNFGMDRP